MLNNEAQAATIFDLLPLTPAAANTAAATSSAWIDIRNCQGDLMIIQDTNNITGSITGKIQDADDSSGTNPADVSGAAFSARSSSHHKDRLVIPARSTRGFIKYVGTIATGPADVSVTAFARPDVV
jgi:hypothetical protein